MTPLETVLARLGHVREVNGEYAASCPTEFHVHGDRSQGLRVREVEDGTVLLFCHAGCSTEEVVAALGLEVRDLRPSAPAADRASVNLRKVFECIREDLTAVEIAAGRIVNGKEFSESDIDCLHMSAKRIRGALRVVK